MHRSLADNASTPVHEAPITSSTRQLTTEFNLPFWIDKWVGEDSSCTVSESDSIRHSSLATTGRALVVAEIRGAGELSDRDFSHAARRAYECIADQARQLALPHPIRIWNTIPAIHQPSIDGDRYMSFNLGRYEAMRQWFGDKLLTRVPAATGVGSQDGSLRVAALLSSEAGTPIENPRQVPAYQYSARFGRLPPCFTRATRWQDLLFIAGTAAVVGEESQHPCEFDRQLAVTIDHLQLMLERGFDREKTRRFASFRVYLPEQSQRSDRMQSVQAALTQLAAARIEFIYADLCRSDLLVEIEAVGIGGAMIPG